MILTSESAHITEYSSLLAIPPRSGITLLQDATMSCRHRFTFNPLDNFTDTLIFPKDSRGYVLGELTDLYPGLMKLKRRPEYVVAMLDDTPGQFIVTEHAFRFSCTPTQVSDITILNQYIQPLPEPIYEALLLEQYDIISAYRISITGGVHEIPRA